jgi:hypothetical protein
MKFKKFLKRLGVVVLSIVVALGLFWAVVNIIPSTKVVEEILGLVKINHLLALIVVEQN